MFLKKEIEEKKLPTLWDETTDWETRRKEIKEILSRELFGDMPPAPSHVTFEELPPIPNAENYCAGKAELKRVLIKTVVCGKEFSFPISAVIPRGGKALPFFVHINFRPDVPDRYMPTEEIVDNGFAVFSFGYESVTADDMDFSDGLAGVLYEGRLPQGRECGKLPMWSWAASRVMDYCQTLDCLDFSKSAVVGHSRLGKTALFTF